MEKARRGMIGIYQLKNVKTGECFIGSSPSICNHFKKHLGKLALGEHPNTSLQQQWDRDGAESFEFVFLEIAANKYTLREREDYWLQKTQGVRIGDEHQYAHDYADGVGRLTISKDLKESLKQLGIGSMDNTARSLILFYKQTSL
ncbi:MAG: GIY-YIG nuclease family protein [Patescibacteria group bacterium]|jgi:hypothetical protein